MRVLLIDDEATIGELTARMLERKFPGLIFHQELNCRAGVDSLRRDEFDIVLVDQKMAEMTGVDCLRTIRHKWPTLPVIMLTGMDDDNLRSACMQAGADDYVSKDGVKELLGEVIWSAIQRRHSALAIETRVASRMDRALLDIGSLVTYVKEGTQHAGGVETRVVQLETSMRKFERIIIEGNGQPSMMSQIATMSTEMKGLISAVDNLKADEKADRSNKRQMWGMVICAILAAIAAVVAAIISGR